MVLTINSETPEILKPPRDKWVELFPQLWSQKKSDCRSIHTEVFMSPDYQPQKQLKYLQTTEESLLEQQIIAQIQAFLMLQSGSNLPS